VARPARLRAAVPELRPALERTAAIAQRLGAQRLEDRRLEAQRQRAAAALGPVVDAMTVVVEAAAAGQPQRAVAGSRDLSGALEELRTLTPP
jgi:hypothetical protein